MSVILLGCEGVCEIGRGTRCVLPRRTEAFHFRLYRRGFSRGVMVNHSRRPRRYGRESRQTFSGKNGLRDCFGNRRAAVRTCANLRDDIEEGGNGWRIGPETGASNTLCPLRPARRSERSAEDRASRGRSSKSRRQTRCLLRARSASSPAEPPRAARL